MFLEEALKEGIKVIGKFIPDKDKQAQAAAEYEAALLAAETELAKAQIETNKIEATNTNIFVSGWRPFIGWVCGFALAYHFIAQPFLAFLCALFEYNITLPIFEMDTLLYILGGLLGLGGLRTYEKKVGVAR